MASRLVQAFSVRFRHFKLIILILIFLLLISFGYLLFELFQFIFIFDDLSHPIYTKFEHFSGKFCPLCCCLSLLVVLIIFTFVHKSKVIHWLHVLPPILLALCTI